MNTKNEFNLKTPLPEDKVEAMRKGLDAIAADLARQSTKLSDYSPVIRDIHHPAIVEIMKTATPLFIEAAAKYNLSAATVGIAGALGASIAKLFLVEQAVLGSNPLSWSESFEGIIDGAAAVAELSVRACVRDSLMGEQFGGLRAGAKTEAEAAPVADGVVGE